MLTCDSSLMVWLTPHMKTLRSGSLALNSFTFWCFTRKCFFLRILAACVVISAFFSDYFWWLFEVSLEMNVLLWRRRNFRSLMLNFFASSSCCCLPQCGMNRRLWIFKNLKRFDNRFGGRENFLEYDVSSFFTCGRKFKEFFCRASIFFICFQWLFF